VAIVAPAAGAGTGGPAGAGAGGPAGAGAGGGPAGAGADGPAGARAGGSAGSGARGAADAGAGGPAGAGAGVIQGLPAYIRTDALVYNTPACTFQQLVTYTSGKYKAVEGVMKMARDGQGPSTPSPSHGLRRLLAIPRTRPTRLEFPALALGETEPPVASPPPANQEQSQPVWGRQDNLPMFLTGPPEDPRRPRICFLCWTAGHMSYTCPILTDQQKALVNKARESFRQATRSRGAGLDDKGRAAQTYNRQLRIAMVQALCYGFDKSDEEEKQDGDLALKLGTEPDKPGSGNGSRGAASHPTPVVG